MATSPNGAANQNGNGIAVRAALTAATEGGTNVGKSKRTAKFELGVRDVT
jgi:hypothetical protein